MIDISKLYNKTFNDIIDDPLEFMKFIDFCSEGNIYNFSVFNKILIYAQKSNSQYVAFYTDWQKLGRIPKKHTAIYIQKEPNLKNTDTHVFALQDTLGQPFTRAWTCDDNILNFINQELFNDEIKRENFTESVKFLTRTYVCGILKVENEKSNLIEGTLTYMLLKRCGIKEIDNISNDIINEFAKIPYHKREEYIDNEFVEVGKTAKFLLNQIAHIVRKAGKENVREQLYGQRTGFNNRGNEIISNAKEGSGSGTGSTGNSNDNEQAGNNIKDGTLWNEGNGVLGGKLLREDDVNDAQGKTSSSGSAESEGSKRIDDNNGKNISEKSSKESDGFHADSESEKSSQNAGGGNSDEGSNLQTVIDDDDNKEYNQLNLFSLDNNVIDNENSSEDSVIQINDKYTYINPKEEDVPIEYIYEALKKGSGFVGGKQRILKLFSENISDRERAKLIKNEYGLGGASWPVEGYGLHGYDSFKAKGLHIQWRDAEGEKEGYISWLNVEKHIKRLIQDNIYLDNDAIKESDIVNVNDNDKQYMVYGVDEQDVKLASTDGSETITVKKEECYKDDSPAKEISGVAIDFSYPDDWKPTIGSDRERFEKNIEAIKTLKKIESERRYATPEEQSVLSHYVGWGGLQNAFDKNRWPNEYKILKDLLTDDEYKAARASVTDSFYTPPEVINNIYSALKRMGFTGGNILEPACGIGNFFNAMPLDMKDNSKLYGIELDTISQKIAQLLHPSAKIENCGYENSKKVGMMENFYDVAIGNVPFGSYKVFDKKYKDKLLIHDYFFEKTIDKVVPGGIICFISSTGTLDKANEKVRRYIAERADLVGAIRLPVDTFSKSANTQTTTDIIFLQKRESLKLCEPDWVFTDSYNDMTINKYFAENPDMMLGKLKKDTSRYGEDRSIIYLESHTDRTLNEQLNEAVHKLPADIFTYNADIAKSIDEEDINTIPAIDTVKNNTYAVIDDVVYYRENSIMIKQILNKKAEQRIKGLCSIRETLKELINKELDENSSDDEINELQSVLNFKYDEFYKEYGSINGKANDIAFCQDTEYPLLCSLEKIVDKKVYKADMFNKRTIKPNIKITSVNTSMEALTVVLNESGLVDLERIMQLTNKSFDEVVKELQGEIFLNPEKALPDNIYAGWETADEYLSGNVRRKLFIAEDVNDEKYRINIEKLKEVQPKELSASDIRVNLGVSWIDIEDYQKYMEELFELNYYEKSKCKISYNSYLSTYYIENKSAANNNANVNSKYGISDLKGISIYENLLNLREIRVNKRVDDGDKVRYVLDQKNTMAAREKADLISDKFKEWLFSDTERRNKYVSRYNEIFNSERLRVFDGSSLSFPGMNPQIELRTHQKDAVARIIRGGNTLLAHCVGAGKTYEMAAACMELKRLKLVNKPIIVVPNHLVGQMASEFMNLYPAANLLVTTKKDFQKNRRRKFTSKIATGEYDCIIMGHSQFEKIGVSRERREKYMNDEIEQITQGIAVLKSMNGEQWTIKQMESTKKKMEEKLRALQNEDYKDNVLNFEELGIDCIFIDEAHNYKNLSFTTKMTRVSGINPQGSNKASDLFLKTQYIQELTPGRNVIFATGTPISNSMAEMYIMQKYLASEQLKKLGIYGFDLWASNFGKVETSLELAPEGNRYREKTRFAKFVNLPELVTIFRQFADVRTPDMVNLDIPKLKNDGYTIIESEPDDYVKKIMQTFVDRAEAIHNGAVKPDEDNMLKVCHDGKLLAMDVRLYDPEAVPDKDCKLNKCVEIVYKKYIESDSIKGIQVIFSDVGVPGVKGEFNVYQYVKDELIKKGIPADEICFIHDAKNDKSRDEMFEDLRNGTKRIIFGSTQKMGTGTNIQKRMVAMHELDVPWRPSDVEQREGRILRQGNINKEVEIFRYVTKGTFDAYNWNILVNKQHFISQVMSSKTIARECEDIDKNEMSYSEVMAAASGDPLIKEKNEVDNAVRKYSMLKKSFDDNYFKLQDNIERKIPEHIKKCQLIHDNVLKDIDIRDKSQFKNIFAPKKDDSDSFLWKVGEKLFTSKSDAGQFIIDKSIGLESGERREVGELCGFKLFVERKFMCNEPSIVIKGNNEYKKDLSYTAEGNLIRIKNALLAFEDHAADYAEKIKVDNKNLEINKKQFAEPFQYEEKLNTLLQRKKEIDGILLDRQKSDEKNGNISELEDDAIEYSHSKGTKKL